jgi:hypothetical protein
VKNPTLSCRPRKTSSQPKSRQAGVTQ